MDEGLRYPVNLTEVIRAQKPVYAHMRASPLLRYQNLSDLIGAEIYIKHENHNPGGTFKIRGGLNVMRHLKAAGIGGVSTFSTGNHGLSIAMSAGYHDMKATVVVPVGANPAKTALIEEAGARLLHRGSNFEEASRAVIEISDEEGLYFIHAANEPHLINGVGTEFLEIIQDLPDIDVVLIPIGAGSELAAATIVLKGINPNIEIIAVQAESSPAAYLSWKKGAILQAENTTFAGGFATGSGFELPFGIYKNAVTDFVLLSESELKEGIAFALKYTKNLAEGAGASTIRAAFKIREKLAGKKVVLQMSGRNIDENILKEVVRVYI